MTASSIPYRDPTASIEERVSDLLERMTFEEKQAQLGSIWAFELVSGGRVQADLLPALLGNGLGEISRLAGSTELGPVDVAEIGNQVQRFLVEQTRLGIPAIIHEESLHGLLARGAPCFQQSIGAAATFDPDVVTRVSATIRRRMLATGARHALAPVLDIARDPRWGRIEETYGEDPYVATAMGLAYISALQGTDLATGVVATGKHLAGHGLCEGGLNQAPVHIGKRELLDEQLLPFEAAVRVAGLASIMPAYCEIDGVPCHASLELLRGLLREAWGFDGVVSSDYLGIELIANQHHLTEDLSVAAGLALAAGVDLELPRMAAYAKPLAEAIADGRMDEQLLDEAAARVLRVKLRLGLFEQPYVALPTKIELDGLAIEEREAGLELARRSLVLVENDGVLPISPSIRSIAVIGPHASSYRDLLGDYSYPVHLLTLQEQIADDVFGLAVTSKIAEPVFGEGRTILDALRDRFGVERVRHAVGTGLREGSDGQIAEAVEVARAADVAILVLGERSGLTMDSTTGEFRDRQGLGLLGRQQELLEAVVATGTPTVLVVVSGRPLALTWAAEHCAAILLSWVPGDAGPDAIAQILAGDEAPGGKLPVTIPRDVGQVPLRYRHHPSGGRSNPRGNHVDGSASPLWPFGFGRSYTTFSLSDLRLDRTAMSTDGGEVAVEATVTNTGRVAGDEVVQLYVTDVAAQVARPVLELGGFRRLRLEPGERATVVFRLSAEQLAYTGAEYRRIVEPGAILISVGTSSDDRPLSATVDLIGTTKELERRREFVTSTAVLRTP